MHEKHDVTYDPTGFGRMRFSCWTCGGRAVIKQPYMSHDQWTEALTDFLKEHPTDDIEIPKTDSEK